MIRRSYSSPVREQAARSTRQQILDAAETLFLADGYSATSIASIAAAAGVTGQTVYNAFGTKSALLKRLYDIRLAGDDQPITQADRPANREIAMLTDGASVIGRYFALAVGIYERVGPLIRVVIAGAAAGDPDLSQLIDTTNGERLTGNTALAGRLVEIGALRPGTTQEDARDVIWVFTSPQLWDLLIVDRGWTIDRTQTWLSDTVVGILLQTG